MWPVSIVVHYSGERFIHAYSVCRPEHHSHISTPRTTKPPAPSAAALQRFIQSQLHRWLSRSVVQFVPEVWPRAVRQIFHIKVETCFN